MAPISTASNLNPAPNPGPGTSSGPPNGSHLSRPSFASALKGDLNRDRSRSKSLKRGPPESSDLPSYVDTAFKTWSNLSVAFECVKTTISDNFNEADSIGPQVLKGFDLLEKCLNEVSNMTFKMANDFEKFKDLSLQHESVIEKNCAGGNIVQNLELTTAYANSCKELKESENHCKILNLDLEQELSSNTDIAKKAREILSKSPNMKDMLKNIQIVPLGKATTLKDNCHSAPILLKAKNPSDRAQAEKSLRNEGYSTAYHWPKNIVKTIQRIRSQISTFEDGEFNLKGKQIMIRPGNDSGSRLNISYRNPDTKKWEVLESVKTPASDDLLEKFKSDQICKSKYFVL